ncbi:MAG: tetratricopeptide repeat protein [Bryobacteraceae bacterium]
MAFLPVLLFLAAMDLREAARLDGEGRCDESEPFYVGALAQGAPTPALLNNAGNHYLICGKPERARLYFERLAKANPSHPNANLQLARLAVQQRQGVRALSYLNRLKSADPAVGLVRAEAMHWAGDREGSLAAMNALATGGDDTVLAALGAAFGRLGHYGRAEEIFHVLVVKNPDDFDLLLQLGRAGARAGNSGRALRSLEAAVRMKPSDPDALLELGLAHAGAKDYSRAVFVLAQAAKQAPPRPDILLPLARAAEDAGFYGDSAIAYDEYVKLKPQDTAARRDRARVLGYTGERLEEGLREMAAYVKEHPRDPVGHYNLAQFTWRLDPAAALAQLDAALRLDAKFVPANVSRAWLLHRLGRSGEAMPHLEAALRTSPDNLRALDLLGLVQLSLDRPLEAEKTLRRALAVGPDDPEVLMHLGRALMALGREPEAEEFLLKHRKARTLRPRDPRKEPGMIAAAALSESERVEREIGRLRRLSESRPDDPALQLHLALLLLSGDKREQAVAEFGRLLRMNADSRIWEEAGRALVRAGRYEESKEFLERAAGERPQARLDLATALLHTAGAEAALSALEGAPDTDDFLLLRARILDAAGRKEEAGKFLLEGVNGRAIRPEMAGQAAMLLAKYGRERQAGELAVRMIAAAPDDAGLRLTHAMLLALMGDLASAEKQVKEIETRWPEWDRAYVLDGLLLESGGRNLEALRKLKIAKALGSTEAAVQCALERLSGARQSAGCACVAKLRDYILDSCSGTAGR